MALSPHHHSGSYLPHKHTSYPGLAIIVLVVGVLLVGATGLTWADTTGEGSYAIQAAVVAPPPTEAPVITNPVNGQHFTTTPIDVRGTCTPGLVVDVYKNDVLAGSALCDASGKFSLRSDLFIGHNDLFARHVDVTNQSGPNSNVVSVFYDIPSAPLAAGGANTGSKGNVIIKSDKSYQGTVPGNELSWQIEILGGTGPYAVSVEWGDGQTELLSRTVAGQFTVRHTYQKAGGYRGGYVVGIKVADSEGTSAFLQVVALVNSPVGAAPAVSTPSSGSGWLRLAISWPLWLIAFLLMLSFWLGERRQRYQDDHERPRVATV